MMRSEYVSYLKKRLKQKEAELANLEKNLTNKYGEIDYSVATAIDYVEIEITEINREIHKYEKE